MNARYEGAKHASHGYFVLFVAQALTTIDALSALRRALRYFLAVRSGEQRFGFGSLWNSVVLKRRADGFDLDEDEGKTFAHEYAGLVHEEPEEIGDLDVDLDDLKAANVSVHNLQQQQQSFPEPDTPVIQEHTRQWANDVRAMHHQHRSSRNSEWRQSVTSEGTLFHQPHHGPRSPRGSHHSDETLHDIGLGLGSGNVAGTGSVYIVPPAKAPLLQRIGSGTFATAERILVFMGYMQVLTGIVTYTGGCRDSYVNGCLAHLISAYRFPSPSLSIMLD